MDYPIGSEMTKGYLSLEVAQAALKLVKDIMLVRKGENVVITADTSSGWEAGCEFRTQVAAGDRRWEARHDGCGRGRFLNPASRRCGEEPTRSGACGAGKEHQAGEPGAVDRKSVV